MRVDVQSFLNSVGLTVISESGEEVILYCPFHNNTDTPSFSVNKKTGLWQCFNPSCGKSGRFASLTKMLAGQEHNLRDDSTYDDVLGMWDKPARSGMSTQNILLDYDNPDDLSKIQYLIDRGYSVETLRHFEIGFSNKRNRVVVPVRDLSYQVVGFIGRSVDPNSVIRYVYSNGFPRKFVLFNLQNAKTYNKVIVTEGSLDAIMVHQCGYPNVVATLGSKLSAEQADLLNRYFDDIVIFSDNDEAGEELGRAIISMCPRKGIEVVRYPEGVKDPGAMSKEQIINCINNAIDDVQYTYQTIENTKEKSKWQCSKL